MKKILFVDDNPLIVRVYCEQFNEAGFEVQSAENGLAAMKALLSMRPDVVVLDLIMPVMNGVDVLRFIRTAPDLKATPVIILSEAYMSELAQEAAKIGPDLTLLKSGCTPALLIDAVNKMLTGAPVEMDTSFMLAIRPKDPPPRGG